MWRTIFLLALSQFGFVPVRVDGTEIFYTLSPPTKVAHPPLSASHRHGALLTQTDNNGNSPSLRIHSLGYTEGRTPSIRLEMGVRDWAPPLCSHSSVALKFTMLCLVTSPILCSLKMTGLSPEPTVLSSQNIKVQHETLEADFIPLQICIFVSSISIHGYATHFFFRAMEKYKISRLQKLKLPSRCK